MGKFNFITGTKTPVIEAALKRKNDPRAAEVGNAIRKSRGADVGPDPEIAGSRQEGRNAAKRRKGRSGSIPTSRRAGALGVADVNRPRLRTTALLGG